MNNVRDKDTMKATPNELLSIRAFSSDKHYALIVSLHVINLNQSDSERISGEFITRDGLKLLY